MFRAKSLASIALLACISSVSAEAGLRIPLKRISVNSSSTGFFLGAELDGNKVSLELDTGATTTMVKNDTWLDDTNLFPRTSSDIGQARTISGDITTEGTYISKFKVAGHTIDNGGEDFYVHIGDMGLFGADRLVGHSIRFQLNTTSPYLEIGAPSFNGGYSLELQDESLLVVPAKLGSSKFKAVFDTGCARTYIQRSAYERARKAGLVYDNADERSQPVEAVAVLGGETAQVYIGHLKNLSVGNITFKDVNVLIMPDETMLAMGGVENTRMILGYNVIQKANWKFDYNTLRWTNSY